MAEEGAIAQQLSLVLTELKEQRSLVTSLQEEVRGHNQSAWTEVKKLMNERELSWKFKGNKVQFEFNEDVGEVLKTICRNLENQNYNIMYNIWN